MNTVTTAPVRPLPTTPIGEIPLVAELLAEGYHLGAPDLETDTIDRANARRLRCGNCRRRPLFLPMTRGASYRIVLACAVCGRGDEA